MAKGKCFEKFVEELERLLNKDSSTTIEKNVHLKSKNGTSRQIDVLLTHNAGRHIFRTVIECKDLKRKVEMKEIDGFASKIRNLDVEKGIMVSKSGFTSGSLKEAQAYSFISLYTIDEIEGVKNEVLGSNKIVFYTITYNSNDWTIRFVERQEINDNIRLYTKLKFVESLKEFDVTEIAQDFLTTNEDLIIHKILEANPKHNNITEAQLTLDINLPQTAFF